MYQCVCDVCACTSQSSAVSSQFSPSMGRALSWPVAMPGEAVNQFNGLWRLSHLWAVPSPRQGSWTKTEERNQAGHMEQARRMHSFLSALDYGCHVTVCSHHSGFSVNGLPPGTMGWNISPCSPLHCFWGATEMKPGPWGAANWPWKSNSKLKGDTWFNGFVSQFSHV